MRLGCHCSFSAHQEDTPCDGPLIPPRARVSTGENPSRQSPDHKLPATYFGAALTARRDPRDFCLSRARGLHQMRAVGNGP